MARRRSTRRTKSSRRRTTSISLTGLAESFVLGSAVTQGLFNVNLAEFVTGTVNGKFNPGADGGQTITIPELMGITKSGWNLSNIGGVYGKTYATSFGDAVKINLKNNGPQALMTLVAAPIAFRFVRKAARKPISQANKLLKGTGVRV
jgi:hypothetical protein